MTLSLDTSNWYKKIECGDKKVFVYDGGLDNVIKNNLSNKLSSTYRGGYCSDPLEDIEYLYLRFKCSLNEEHKFEYFFVKRDSQIIKVGQYPSYADIEIPQALKYKNILGNKYYNELKRSFGLYSCNVGIGSFVYLRRIIEKLIYDAFKEAEGEGKLTENEFEYQNNGRYRNGMESKIKLLKGYLPDLITSNPKIYGVVSKGIHELSEEECLNYFPVLKCGILMILDDLISRKEKERAVKEYEKSLGKIISDIK